MTVARFFRPIGYVLILVLALAPLFVLVNRVSARVDAAEKREGETYASFQQAQAAVDKLSQQVTALGGDPVVEPSEIAKAPAPQTSSSVTSAMVREAVQAYCAGGACDGRRPTLAQVASALTQYCSSGACRGAAGKNGVAGPAPTQQQIAQAVADYCASGACKGEPGKDGTNGKDGPNGLDGKNGTDGKDGNQGPAGPKGEPGANGSPGPAGSVTPGDYGCPSGEYVTSIHVASDGSMSLGCSGVIAAPAPAAEPTP